MLTKYIAASLAGSAMLATAAFAQTPTTNAGHPANQPAPAAAASDSSTFQGDWRTSKVVGLNVYNDNNESIGSINDLLTDKSGNIKAAVISVGGFLGVGSHLVAVPFDKIKFVDEPVRTASSTSTSPPSGSKPAPSTTTGAAGSSSSMAPAKTNPWYPDHAVFNATKDQLKAMPEFKFSS